MNLRSFETLNNIYDFNNNKQLEVFNNRISFSSSESINTTESTLLLGVFYNQNMTFKFNLKLFKVSFACATCILVRQQFELIRI
jgi:hypothetical protein